jgi:hypothetical protein
MECDLILKNLTESWVFLATENGFLPLEATKHLQSLSGVPSF